MNLTLQKKLAADVLRCSPKKIWCDPENMTEIKEAITKADIKRLFGTGVIRAKPIRGISQGRTRKAKAQKRKGLRKHAGSRKGKRTARLSRKQSWMNKIRVQREFIKELKEKGYLDSKSYRELYLKTKGGFFRSRRHIKIYIEDNKMIDKNKVPEPTPDKK